MYNIWKIKLSVKQMLIKQRIKSATNPHTHTRSKRRRGNPYNYQKQKWYSSWCDKVEKVQTWRTVQVEADQPLELVEADLYNYASDKIVHVSFVKQLRIKKIKKIMAYTFISYESI